MLAAIVDLGGTYGLSIAIAGEYSSLFLFVFKYKRFDIMGCVEIFPLLLIWCLNVFLQVQLL